MNTLISKALVVVLILGFAQGALAEEVRFDFSGHIVEIEDSDSVLDSTGITTSSMFVGTITYDSDASPTHIEEPPNVAYYPGTLLSVTIDNDYTTQSLTPEVLVVNDYPQTETTYLDLFGFGADSENGITTSLPESIDRITSESWAIFQLPGPSPLANTELPLALDLNDFPDERMIEIYGIDSLLILGELDTLERIYPDGDSDGVPDHLDLCPSTQEGTPVKTNGCVEGDYNNDGNIDGADLAEFSDRFGM